jgi:hypothetical protein
MEEETGFKFNWSRVQESKRDLEYKEILRDLGVKEYD